MTGELILMHSLIEVLIMVLVTCIQTFFYYKTIGFNEKWRGRRLILVMLSFSIIVAIPSMITINVPKFIEIPAGLIFCLVMILYPVFFMGSGRKERLFFGIVNFAMYMFALTFDGVVFNAIIKMLSNIQVVSTFYEIHIVHGPVWLVGLLMFLPFFVIYALLVLIITRLSTTGRRFIPRQYWLGMMIGFTAVVAALVVEENLGSWIRDPNQIFHYVMVGSLILLVVWLLLYFIFYFVCRYFSKAAEADILAVQNEMMERYILRRQASDERIKILSHDLKHSLLQWRALAQEKGDANALQSISEYEGQLSSSLLVNVANESANAIINQKVWEAGQEQVEIQIDGTFYEDLCMSKMDLCSLLGNLLDNAIEAAAQIETNNLRRVKLSIRRKGNLLILLVENGYKFKPVIEDGGFVTRKKDKDSHAIGTLSIRYITEKYVGIVRNSYEDNWFKATVMLCGYRDDQPNVFSDEK